MRHTRIILVSVVLRLALIMVAAYFEDSQHQYLTDIDYKIYSQAAELVSQGQSPYDRHTYRYSPLVAYVMLVNKYLGFSAGKYVLVVFDVLTMLLLVKAYKGVGDCKLALQLYGYNPVFVYLTARGSIQSINSVFFLATYLLVKDRKSLISGVVYGLWVSFRVYPVIFGITILLYLSKKLTNLRKIWSFLFGSALSFGLLTLSFYMMYGDQFIRQNYLYHFTRVDHRHNLSVYFYNTYLQMSEPKNFIISILPATMTILLLREIKAKYSHNLEYSFFLISYVFVLFNKVLTVQYYMWAHVPILLILPYCKWVEFKLWRAGLHAYLLWLLGVMLWVWCSIQVETYGRNIFKMMWLSCLFRFAGETWILLTLFKYMKFDKVNQGRFKDQGKLKGEKEA